MGTIDNGMRVELTFAREMARRRYLSINTSSMGLIRGEITYGADIVWTCPHLGHKTTIVARECASRQLRRLERSDPHPPSRGTERG